MSERNKLKREITKLTQENKRKQLDVIGSAQTCRVTSHITNKHSQNLQSCDLAGNNNNIITASFNPQAGDLHISNVLNTTAEDIEKARQEMQKQGMILQD